eukprot:2861552-Alexandrium_andersonii.AAC.1
MVGMIKRVGDVPNTGFDVRGPWRVRQKAPPQQAARRFAARAAIECPDYVAAREWRGRVERRAGRLLNVTFEHFGRVAQGGDAAEVWRCGRAPRAT